MAEEEIEFREEEGMIHIKPKSKKKAGIWDDEPVKDDEVIWNE